MVSETAQLQFRNEYLRERSSALQTLATDIDELHGVMSCLQGHIAEDATKVDAVEAHVENTAANVGVGEKMLRQVRRF